MSCDKMKVKKIYTTQLCLDPDEFPVFAVSWSTLMQLICFSVCLVGFVKYMKPASLFCLITYC